MSEVVCVRFDSRQIAPNDDEDCLALEVPLLDDLNKALIAPHLPILVLGSGRATLADKFVTIMFDFLNPD